MNENAKIYGLTPHDPTDAFYHCDGSGNVTALVDTNGQILAHYSYDPFGNILAQSGPLADANLYRFSSKEFHPNSGLVYYGLRFYDPNLQRWLNRDPLGDWGSLTYIGPSLDEGTDSGSAAGMDHDEFAGLLAQINGNVFGALNNDPMNRWDLLGLKTCTGEARVLQGNKGLIGASGGFSTDKESVKVTANTAAVAPAQWGGKGSLRPNLAKISGTFTDSSGKQVGSFSGVSDVIGGKSPIPDKNVRDALKQLNPGKLLVELPSADKDLGTVKVTLTVPDNSPCPEGTK